MNKNIDFQEIPEVLLTADDLDVGNDLNAGYTAIPKTIMIEEEFAVDLTGDLIGEPVEYGEMNEADARESGYIQEPAATISRWPLKWIGPTVGIAALGALGYWLLQKPRITTDA